MKPLHLEVSGLHSYLQPVSIDFERLGRYGLFGIFGPIGAGKSSLLDAITLALYGLVDRVSGRSRRGIIHLDAEQVEVRFRFSVRDAEGAELPHEVHRVYRATATGVQRVASRLVRLDNEEVLADKERELNDAIEKLIGLCSEDFMRAVVLPQGRFMEVLHLKGSDRRRMLQRMFRLHAYGERLRQKLRHRQNQAQRDVARLEGELAGLGDASAASLQRAERAAAAARRVRDQAVIADEHAELRLREATRRRQQQASWREAVGALEAHREHAEAHAELKARWEAAEAARPRVRPARQWLAAHQALPPAAQRHDRAQQQLSVATASEEQATATLAAATAAAHNEEPRLRERVARLEEAVAWGQERASLQRQAERWQAEVEGQQARCAKLQAHVVSASEAVQPLDVRRRALRRDLERARVQPEERAQVDAVADAHRAVTAARSARADAAARVAACDEAVAEAERHREQAHEAHQEARRALEQAASRVAEARAEAADARPDRREAIRELRARCERVLAQAHSAAARLEALREAEIEAEAAQQQADEAAQQAEALAQGSAERVQGAEQALARARQADLDALERHIAARMAQRLTPGEACAVCGSTEHPLPAPQAEAPEESAAVSAHRQGRAVALERQRVAAAALGRAHQARSDAHQRLEQAREASAEAATALRVLWEELPEVEQAPSPLEAAQALLADTLSRAEAAQAASVRLDAARAAHEQAAVQAAASEAPIAAAQRDVVRAGQQRSEAEAALAQAEASAGAAWEAWSEAAGDQFTFFDVPHARTGLRARDADAARIDRELEAAEAERIDLLRRRDEAKAQLAQRQAELSGLAERRASVAEQLERIEAQLQERTGGVDPTKALASARAELEGLQRAHTHAQRLATKGQAAVAEARAAAAAAQARHEAAVQALLEAREALAAVAGPLPEADDDLLVCAQRWSETEVDDEQLQAWSTQLHRYAEEGSRLIAREELLRPSEAQPAPDDTTYEQLTADREARKAALQQARHQAARAEQEHDELQARSLRFDTLQAELAGLRQQLDHIDHLAKVLRGDRFVDFVANDLLADLAVAASRHLARLTEGRYALAVDEDGGFLIRDNDAGGAVRPVHTLSGGEAFLTSLALALALSTEVQARGPRPLEFFFLDEGFGTLDPEALDRVMTAIEALRDGHRLIGLISHVPGVRERVPSHVLVHPAGARGKGSTVELVVG